MFIKPREDAKDRDKRNVTVMQTLETKGETEINSFSFSAVGVAFSHGKESMSEEGDKVIHSVKIICSDGGNRNYELTYQVLREGALVEEEKGMLDLREATPTYVPVPELKEALTALDKMIYDFEREYHLDLEDKGFLNVPSMCKDLDFSHQNVLENADANRQYYYSNTAETSSGHKYVWLFTYVGNYEYVQFGQYDITSKAYALLYDVILEASVDTNLYDMKIRSNVIQKVAIVDDIIYIYSPEMSEEDIKYDMDYNKCQNAAVILANREFKI